MTGRRLLARYFWISFAVIGVNALILWAMWPVQILQPRFLGLVGGVGTFLAMTSPSAVFGLIAGLLLVFRVDARGQRSFFGTAAIINFIVTYCMFGVISQTLLDCSGACVGPSQTVVLYLAAACTIVTVLPPAIIYFACRRRFVDEPDELDGPGP